jgi:hypothetical protein
VATNNDKSDGYLNGAIRERSQFQHPNGHWVERNTTTGQFTNVKHDLDKLKSVRREN